MMAGESFRGEGLISQSAVGEGGAPTFSVEAGDQVADHEKKDDHDDRDDTRDIDDTRDNHQKRLRPRQKERPKDHSPIRYDWNMWKVVLAVFVFAEHCGLVAHPDRREITEKGDNGEDIKRTIDLKPERFPLGSLPLQLCVPWFMMISP